jgi:TRAP-type C4-dicarboxylate transport system permease large subunit
MGILLLEEISMTIGKMLQVGILLAMIPALSGCWYAAAAGAGAYGGYKMKEKGYTVQSPVTQEKRDKGQNTEESE